MDISLFDYHLPQNFIAQEPVKPRDHSRLLVLDRKTGAMEHKKFFEILEFLRPTDVLVFNNAEVFKARIFGKKKTGGKVEIFLLRPQNKPFFDGKIWPKKWVVISRPSLKDKQKIIFSKNLFGVIKNFLGYEKNISFNLAGKKLATEISHLGQTPLPPYVKNPTARSYKNYQTVFAKKIGSVAAPTAGLHFTKSLLAKIRAKKIQTEFLTLHVGLGTFLPVKEREIEKHKIHREYFCLSPALAKKLNQYKKEGRRIIAVGTTATRVLETCVVKDGQIKPKSAWTILYIYPGYHFKFINAMITNFHLPKSTLLMLVSAFAGREKILRAYQEAIQKKYRFFSFGDAMMIK